jgi:hypothetical protein
VFSLEDHGTEITVTLVLLTITLPFSTLKKSRYLDLWLQGTLSAEPNPTGNKFCCGYAAEAVSRIWRHRMQAMTHISLEALEDTIVTSKNVIWCDLKDEAVVLHISSGVYFGLEGVSVYIWQYIQTPRKLSEVIDHLMSRFEVTRDVCIERTGLFIEELAQHDLIVRSKHADNA